MIIGRRPIKHVQIVFVLILLFLSAGIISMPHRRMQRLPNKGGLGLHMLGLVLPQNVSQQSVTGAGSSTIRFIPLDLGWL